MSEPRHDSYLCGAVGYGDLSDDLRLELRALLNGATKELRATIYDCCTMHLNEGLTAIAQSTDKRDIESRSKQRAKRLAYLTEMRAARGVR